MEKSLSESQIQALCFYEGDISALTQSRGDSFWQDKKAYCTLNSLFFPGIVNELARTQEGKKLNAAFLDDTERLMRLCMDLISACHCAGGSEPARSVYRVERFSSFAELHNAGQTVSFTSTSSAGFLPEYGDKRQLVLLEFRLPQGIPQANLSKLLPYYQKAFETEILLPPWLSLDFFPRQLLDGELLIRDCDGNPPLQAFIITPRVSVPEKTDIHNLHPAYAEAGKRVMAALNSGAIPENNDVIFYSAWKEAFQCQLKNWYLTIL